MKIYDQFSKKNKIELYKELSSLLKAKFSVRMRIATRQTTNVSQLKKIRRDIARIKTILVNKVH